MFSFIGAPPRGMNDLDTEFDAETAELFGNERGKR
jgi:hypothetical protein